MKFYTSVEQRRNDLLVRGYENGKRVQRRIAYKPYLFVPTKQPSQYKTLDGKQVDKIQFDVEVAKHRRVFATDDAGSVDR